MNVMELATALKPALLLHVLGGAGLVAVAYFDRSSAHHLKPKGLLSINIPDSRGLGFRLARFSARFGLGGAYERLRQMGLPSPHLWYLSSKGLTEMGASAGLVLVRAQHLPAVYKAGLWERIHMDRKPNPVSRLQFAVISALRPLLNSERFSETLLIIFAKPDQA